MNFTGYHNPPSAKNVRGPRGSGDGLRHIAHLAPALCSLPSIHSRKQFIKTKQKIKTSTYFSSVLIFSVDGKGEGDHSIFFFPKFLGNKIPIPAKTTPI